MAEAKKVKGVWWYRIYWLHYPAPTWERSSTLRDAGSEVQAEMITARERLLAETNLHTGSSSTAPSDDRDEATTIERDDQREQETRVDDADDAEGLVSSRTRSSRQRRSAAISLLDAELPSLTPRHSWYDSWFTAQDDLAGLEI